MERVQAVYVLNNINLNTIFVWGNQNQNRLCPVQPLCNAMQLTSVVFKDRASYGFQCPPKEEHSATSPWGMQWHQPIRGDLSGPRNQPHRDLLLFKDSMKSPACLQGHQRLTSSGLLNFVGRLSLIHPVNYVNPKAFVWLDSQLDKLQVPVWIRRARVQFVSPQMEVSDSKFTPRSAIKKCQGISCVSGFCF